MPPHPPIPAPRILVVGPFPPTKGGVTTFMLNLTGSFLKEQFDFIPFQTARPPKQTAAGNWGYGAMLNAGLGHFFLSALVTAWHVLGFPFVLIARRIDLVQVQASDYQAFWESAAYAWLAKRLGRPVVMRIGGSFDAFVKASSPRAQGLIRQVLGVADVVIAQTEIARGVIERAGRTGEIIVVPNWSRDEALHDAERRPTDAPVFLFVVGADPQIKGAWDFLEAARLLETQGSAARLHLIACPPPFEAAVRAHGLSNIVALEGLVPNTRILEAMCVVDALVMASHSEGFPNTLVEAMGCGLPVIVTPVGGIPEIVETGGGVLTLPRDPPALAAAIEGLACDREKRLALGRAALNTVKTRYVASCALPKLQQAYERLLR